MDQEPNTSLTAQDVMNELDLLSCETLDKDSIEKNLNRLIDWFKNTSQSKMEQSFLSELPDKLGALFGNMKDQVGELDYNATGKLKMALKNMAEVDLLKDHLESFDRNHKLKGEIEDHFQELMDKLKDQSKKIKKQKNLEKRKKLYDAERQDRVGGIKKSNDLLKEDDETIKGETFSLTKYEENPNQEKNFFGFSN